MVKNNLNKKTLYFTNMLTLSFYVKCLEGKYLLQIILASYIIKVTYNIGLEFNKHMNKLWHFIFFPNPTYIISFIKY